MKQLAINPALKTLLKLGPELQPRYFYWLQQQTKEVVSAIMEALGASAHQYVIMHGVERTLNTPNPGENTYAGGWVWDVAAQEFVVVPGHVIANQTYVQISKTAVSGFPNIRYADSSSKQMFLDNQIQFVANAGSGFIYDDIPHFDDLLRKAIGYEAWQTPSLNLNVTLGSIAKPAFGTWADHTDWKPLRYRKVPGNLVQFNGVTSGVAANGSVMFALPAEYLPLKSQYLTTSIIYPAAPAPEPLIVEVNVSLTASNTKVIAVRGNGNADHIMFWDCYMRLD